jgi:hypothetical protein
MLKDENFRQHNGHIYYVIYPIVRRYCANSRAMRSNRYFITSRCIRLPRASASGGRMANCR